MSTACPEIHKPHNLVNPLGPHRTAGLVTCLDLCPHPEYVRNTVAFWTLDTISLQQYSQCDEVILNNNVSLFLSKNGADIMHFFFHRIFFVVVLGMHRDSPDPLHDKQVCLYFKKESFA